MACPLQRDERSSNVLNDLASALYQRFKQLGKVDDLQEAIAFRPPG
jgi:hypothetical protein